MELVKRETFAKQGSNNMCTKYIIRKGISNEPLKKDIVSFQQVPLHADMDHKKYVNQKSSFHWQGIIIPLQYHKGRLLMKSTYNLIHPCFSADGLVPAHSLKNPIAKRCSICSFNGRSALNQKSAKCSLIHSLLAFIPMSREIFSFSVIQPASQNLQLLLAAIAVSGGELHHYQVRLHMYYVYQNSISLAMVKFSHLNKCAHEYVDKITASIALKWQPSWLQNVTKRSTGDTILEPLHSPPF
jgi:hypothetical protein